MSKTSKGKKGKVPRLTEAEYAEYISALRASETPHAATVQEEKTPSMEKKITEKPH